MQFFGRLSLDVTVYLEIPGTRSSQRTVDASSGYISSIINAGRVRNNGIEIGLNANRCAGVLLEHFGTFLTQPEQDHVYAGQFSVPG